MLQQKVTIPLLAESGIKLGDLIIGTRNKGRSLQETDPRMASFYFDQAYLENIVLAKSPGDSIPIEFLETMGGSVGTQLLLLEETEYQVLFRSEYEIDESRGDKVLLELTKGCVDGGVIIDRWLLDDDKKMFRGVINFASYVGKSFFDVKINGQSSVKFPFEVRSKKMGYQDQYPAMIGDLSEACSGLMLDRKSPLYQELQFSDASRSIHYEDYMFLEYVFRPDRLPMAYDGIRRNPYSQLKRQMESIPAALASCIDYSGLIDIATGRGEFEEVHNDLKGSIPQLNGLFPSEVYQSTNFEDIDVPENQLVKDLLLSLDYVINCLLDSTSKLKDGYAKERIQQFKESIQSYLADGWLNDIGQLQHMPSNSQVLQRREGYMSVQQYYSSLDLSFRFRWKEFEDSLEGYNRRLSQLYEYWCYLELVKVLARLSNSSVKYDDLFQKSSDGWSIQLRRGVNSIKDFFINVDDRTVKVSLMYNRVFSRQKGHENFRSYTFAFKPDYTLCIDSGDAAFLIHFDAKYRSDREESTTFENDEEVHEITRTFWEDDVCKMHTYKDAILNTAGAYILYPGGGEADIFQIEEGKEIPSVGAFSLTPGRNRVDQHGPDWFIKSILNRILADQ